MRWSEQRVRTGSHVVGLGDGGVADALSDTCELLRSSGEASHGLVQVALRLRHAAYFRVQNQHVLQPSVSQYV